MLAKISFAPLTVISVTMASASESCFNQKTSIWLLVITIAARLLDSLSA
jgi:hypothetical protein